jgi:hypothetical protein
LTYKVTFWDKSKALEMEYKHHGLLVDRIEINVCEELVARLAAARKRTDGSPTIQR